MPISEEKFYLSVEKHIDFNYLSYLPPNYNKNNKSPLFVFLHGAGEREDELNLVARHGFFKISKNGGDFPFVMVAHQCPQNKYWGNYLESLTSPLIEVSTSVIVALLFSTVYVYKPSVYSVSALAVTPGRLIDATLIIKHTTKMTDNTFFIFLISLYQKIVHIEVNTQNINSDRSETNPSKTNANAQGIS